MATKKKLLQAAAGTAAAGGAGGLNVEDVFSTYLYEGNGDTQVIENGINLGQSNSGASIFFPDGDGDYLATASLPQFTGAFTFEFWFYSYDSARAVYLIDKGVRDTNFSIQTNYLTDDQLFVKVAATSFSYTTAGLDADGWNHIAVVRDSSNNVATFVNGTRRGSPTTASGSVTGGVYYIGSSSAGTSAAGYELMYGHMSSVRISDTARYSTSSTSITVPTSEYTSDSNTVLLLGQGDTPLADASSNSYSVTVNGNPRASEVGPFTAADAGEGGLVWIKNRTLGTWNILFDTDRGTEKVLHTNETDAQANRSETLTFFNASGFSLGAGGAGNANSVNTSTNDYASWTFRKAPKFFDVVTYTGTGSVQTISHNLGTTVGTLIIKATNKADNWIIYHRSQGATKYGRFTTDEFFTSSSQWNNTEPTDSVFTVNTDGAVNDSGDSYVAYLFAHNDGDGDFGPTGDQDIIKCGSYTKTDTGGTNFIEVNLGFEVQWLLVKATSESGNWEIWDVQRGLSYNGAKLLNANSNSAESSYPTVIRPTPNGFEYNDNNAVSYIYIAIRRGPMAVPESATDVFAQDNKDGDDRFDSGWPVDFTIQKNDVTVGGSSWILSARLQGNYYLSSNNTSNESANNMRWDTQDGASYGTNTTDADDWGWMWRRAPNYFDVVAYTGNGTAGRTVSHNLGVAPEMMWVKRRNAVQDWKVYHTGLTSASYELNLNQTSAESATSVWAGTDPTDTVFSVGGNQSVNNSGDNYIAYLFASLDGVSKVGSYTGNGTNQNIDCGFSSGARFVLIKRSSGLQSWYLFDSERGITSLDDKALLLNTTDAEDTWSSGATDINPYSAGFTLDGNGVGSNENGETYIFYAIA